MRTSLHAALAVLFLIVLAAVSPAQAQKISGMGANIYGNYFNFAKANLPAQAVSAIKAGPLTVKLQSTKLSEVTKRFGGTILRAGGIEGVSWVCYHTGDANTWFISNALGGQEFVMMVAVEASTRQPGDCEAANDKFVVPDLGIPGVGASTADLKAKFGAASGSKIAYRHDRPGGYTNTAQYIGYVMKGGKVSGVGVGETSVMTEH